MTSFFAFQGSKRLNLPVKLKYMQDLSIIPQFLDQMLMSMKHKPEKDQLSITLNSRVFTEELLNFLNY